MKYGTIKGISHYIFDSDDEISNFFGGNPPTIVNDWRNGIEGDWVRSDDGCILQLLKVSKELPHPGDRKNYKWTNGWLRTVVGTFIIRNDTYMDTDFDKHPDRYTFSGKKKTPHQRIKERESATKREKIFATNIAVGMGPVKSYMDAFEKEQNPQSARKKAVLLLKQERIMKEVEKSVLDVAKELGIDHKYILDKLKCLAENTDDMNIVLQATKELGKAVGTMGTTVRQKEMGIVGMFSGFTPQELEGAKRSDNLEIEGNMDEKE
jgi:hypothetical protein|tara:strand:- start:922 stop:1716 length:795 start_codon:yes stop_codon:yes gene_type:complete